MAFTLIGMHVGPVAAFEPGNALQHQDTVAQACAGTIGMRRDDNAAGLIDEPNQLCTGAYFRSILSVSTPKTRQWPSSVENSTPRKIVMLLPYFSFSISTGSDAL